TRRRRLRARQSNDGITRLSTSKSRTDFCRDAGVDLNFVIVPARAEDRVMQIFYKLFALRADIRVSTLNSKLRLNARVCSFIGRNAKA
ncbi:MAG: hypothetical protein JSS54_16645, partial [Proteobacteria bacterium]|nr:hypothetical protein [Pseudomonadota bacterium]